MPIKIIKAKAMNVKTPQKHNISEKIEIFENIIPILKIKFFKYFY